MEKTIAEQLGIKDFPFEIKDKNGNEIYFEDLYGTWYKRELDENQNVIYLEISSGFWSKREFDKNGNEIYYEDSNEFWYKKEYDKNGKEIYYEDSDGYIEDNRPNELTMQEIADKFGIKVEQLKIKK